MSKYLEEFIKECEKNNISDEVLSEYKVKINKLDRLSKEQAVSSEYEWNQSVREYVRKLGNVKNIFNSSYVIGVLVKKPLILKSADKKHSCAV